MQILVTDRNVLTYQLVQAKLNEIRRFLINHELTISKESEAIVILEELSGLCVKCTTCQQLSLFLSLFFKSQLIVDSSFVHADDTAFNRNQRITKNLDVHKTVVDILHLPFRNGLSKEQLSRKALFISAFRFLKVVIITCVIMYRKFALFNYLFYPIVC